MQDDKALSTTSVFMDKIRIQLGPSSLGCLTLNHGVKYKGNNWVPQPAYRISNTQSTTMGTLQYVH